MTAERDEKGRFLPGIARPRDARGHFIKPADALPIPTTACLRCGTERAINQTCATCLVRPYVRCIWHACLHPADGQCPTCAAAAHTLEARERADRYARIPWRERVALWWKERRG